MWKLPKKPLLATARRDNETVDDISNHTQAKEKQKPSSCGSRSVPRIESIFREMLLLGSSSAFNVKQCRETETYDKPSGASIIRDLS